jgi:16S rRNA processing protein RimM
VGRVAKPHGLSGEVVVESWSDLPQRLEPGSVLVTDTGPLTVDSARPHQGRHLVRFAGVDDREGAERLRATVLRAAPVADPDQLWIHDLVGATVKDANGTVLGTVAAVEANPASDLLVLDTGGLIPLRFVTETVPQRAITVEIPDGLLE